MSERGPYGAHPVGRGAGSFRGERSEDGQFLAMTVVFMTMFLALAGLVADGGRYFDAKQAAASEAEQAARAGAGFLDVSQLHAGTVAIDPATATATAESYMTAVRPPRDAPGSMATPSTPRSATANPPSSSGSSASRVSRSP